MLRSGFGRRLETNEGRLADRRLRLSSRRGRSARHRRIARTDVRTARPRGKNLAPPERAVCEWSFQIGRFVSITAPASLRSEDGNSAPAPERSSFKNWGESNCWHRGIGNAEEWPGARRSLRGTSRLEQQSETRGSRGSDWILPWARSEKGVRVFRHRGRPRKTLAGASSTGAHQLLAYKRNFRPPITRLGCLPPALPHIFGRTYERCTRSLDPFADVNHCSASSRFAPIDRLTFCCLKQRLGLGSSLTYPTTTPISPSTSALRATEEQAQPRSPKESRRDLPTPARMASKFFGSKHFGPN